ncbi:type VI secretion system outer membrane protein, OmpA/MotB [Desulfosarcina variabilis str. Montpellier]|uniref:type IVB secretion system protein IcmH/DotU n=1 Tax=Desulfosarcina variabilis TaxID=2300 RepID=UPI003AFA8800
MSPSDPFSTDWDAEKTILRPSPGGRRRRASGAPSPNQPYSAQRTVVQTADFLAADNPFVTHAFSLLSVVPKLRKLPYHHAVDDLLDQMANSIGRFEKQLTGLGIEQKQIKTASYLLCTLIDETVLNTPWGSQSNWGSQSLLIQFHSEAKGGERFFQILDQLQARPQEHLNLLELAYLCLGFGFEGKYRHVASGMRDLDRLREDLYLLIRQSKGNREDPLSIHWQGMKDKRAPIEKHVPVWVGAVVAAALLAVIYMGFVYAINTASNRTYQRLAETTREVQHAAAPVDTRRPAATSASVAPRPPTHRFEQLLDGEIARGMVEIVNGNLLRITDAFPSGSDRLDAAYVPMVQKIARALETDNGLVLVIGHTDNRPIFSARFPSNWHLSQARARNVALIMSKAASLDDRVRYDGRAASEPVRPNDTAANRSKNRRIDIHIR